MSEQSRIERLARVAFEYSIYAITGFIFVFSLIAIGPILAIFEKQIDNDETLPPFPEALLSYFELITERIRELHVGLGLKD